MGANSAIEWCTHTFNGWIGCTKVSPGCANCYAAVSTRARVLRARGLETWGHGAERVRTGTWGEPQRWNRLAKAARISHEDQTALGFDIGPYRRPSVFASSLCDWLDDEVPAEWLSDLLYLASKCDELAWLFLTKRPGLWEARMRAVAALQDIGGQVAEQWLAGRAPKNFAVGVTVENQQMAEKRIPELLRIPARIRFLSCEPLLGSLALDGSDGGHDYIGDPDENESRNQPGIDWVICGGESGPKARPMHPDWARSLRDQCEEAGVPFLFKQWGEWVPITPLYEGRDEDFEGAADPDRTAVVRKDGSVWPWEWGQPPLEGNPHIVEHVGKKAAGRLLDGREHMEYPTW